MCRMRERVKGWLFENIVTKEEIAQNEQFLLLPQCFQFFLVIIPTLIEIFHIFEETLLKSSAADVSYEGKG